MYKAKYVMVSVYFFVCNNTYCSSMFVILIRIILHLIKRVSICRESLSICVETFIAVAVDFCYPYRCKITICTASLIEQGSEAT